jgi:hypothetical protein
MTPAKPAPPPPQQSPAQEPVLGWTRPTGILLMASGLAVLGVGALLAGTFAVVRWYLFTRVEDAVLFNDLTRALVPLALAAAGAILLSVPVTGTGLALFFLSGSEGPLRNTASPAE